MVSSENKYHIFNNYKTVSDRILYPSFPAALQSTDASVCIKHIFLLILVLSYSSPCPNSKLLKICLCIFTPTYSSSALQFLLLCFLILLKGDFPSEVCSFFFPIVTIGRFSLLTMSALRVTPLKFLCFLFKFKKNGRTIKT